MENYGGKVNVIYQMNKLAKSCCLSNLDLWNYLTGFIITYYLVCWFYYHSMVLYIFIVISG